LSFFSMSDLSSEQPLLSNKVSAAQNGSRFILLVDDEEAIRSMGQLILEMAGHRVICAESGLKAQRLLEREPVELIITDMLMPDGDGLELLAMLKKLPSPPRTIVMSGGGLNSVDYYLKLAKQLGAHHVLNKPFSSAELLASVDAVFASGG
jgi:CheY-like chemotaxis protein